MTAPSKSMGDAGLGIITGFHYDPTHKSAKNEAFVKAFNEDYKRNPDFFSVGGWDGMQLIYDVLKKTGGKTDAQALIDAAKGSKWGKPARPDLDRSGNPRHHPGRLYPSRGKGRRQGRQCRVRQGRGREGSGERADEEVIPSPSVILTPGASGRCLAERFSTGRGHAALILRSAAALRVSKDEAARKSGFPIAFRKQRDL